MALGPWQAGLVRVATSIQDRYDRLVFAMPDPSTRYPGCAEEEIHAPARQFRGALDARWYPVTLQAPEAVAVLNAQRSSTVWSRRLHQERGRASRDGHLRPAS